MLDLSPVSAGSSGAVALRNSIDLAQFAEQLGFKRYWVAEHHNLPSVASSAPEIMIGQIAAATTHIRVGSGGVMLPNHAPLMVAERFKVLEALFPGRIDLGLGRAPGTDPVTSYALRRRQQEGTDDDFLERFQELILFESNAFPEGHPFRNVHAMPSDVALPPIWLLGSSGYSAQLAGMVGAGLLVRASFLRLRRGRRDAELPRAFPSVAGARQAVRDARRSRRCAPTATRKRTGWPPRSISIGCAARAANCCRSRVRKRRRIFPTRRSISNASAIAARGCSPARRRRPRPARRR